MSVFFQNQGLLNGIHSIPEDMRNQIMALSSAVYGSEMDTLHKSAAEVINYIKLYNEAEAEQNAKEEIMDNLTDDQNRLLEETHMKDYHGTDDDAPDDYGAWLEDLTSTELKAILV